MRPPRREAGDPAETAAPTLPATPRPCVPAPSLVLRSRAFCAQTPRHAVPATAAPSPRVRTAAARDMLSPVPRAGLPPRGGRALSDGPSGGETGGPSSSSLTRDLDRRLLNPGEAPKLEAVFWPCSCPLPGLPRWEEHPLSLAPLPASSAVKSRHAAAGGAGVRPPQVPGWVPG